MEKMTVDKSLQKLDHGEGKGWREHRGKVSKRPTVYFLSSFLSLTFVYVVHCFVVLFMLGI
jgi:hypothetical protein